MSLVALAALAALGFAAAPDVVHLAPAQRTARVQPPPARFSHGSHRGFGCYECHPGLFSAPRARVTHADMKRGLACGACHDGAFARSVQALGCASCHAK